MADLAREYKDESLLAACRRLWKHAVSRLLYLTGGLGSSRHNEGFTDDYDLPNDTAYAETCAGIALIFFAHRMLHLDPRSEYADFMELALYCPNFGYYQRLKASTGQKGDFFTSVSVGGLFGELLASRFAEWLGELPGDGKQIMEAAIKIVKGRSNGAKGRSNARKRGHR